MAPVKAEVTKRERRDSVYYTITWSALKKTDKHEIRKNVPSITGIYEIYYMDRKHGLNLMAVSKAWYGGLRNEIRQALDPELERDDQKKRILETRPCYYRYSAVSSYSDLNDLFFFFCETHYPHMNLTTSSARYKHIYVKEISQDKIIDRWDSR
jgi:hypothetical protein